MFKKPVEGALFLFDKGFKVFPLKENKKIPLIEGWQLWAETADINKIKNFGIANPLSNWGVYCELSELIVIDIDNKNNKKGSDTLELLKKQNLILPPSLTVQTPTGGYHFYYKGLIKSKINGLGSGIDIKSKGGYVVCPGSRINEKIYQITANPDLIEKAPDWLLNFNAQKNYSNINEKDLINISLNQDHHINRVIQYLTKEAPPSIENNGGNSTLYQVACQIKNMGVSNISLAKNLISGYYDKRCIPSWLTTKNDITQWHKTIESAYKGSKEPAGSKTPEADFIVKKEDIKINYNAPIHISIFKDEAPQRNWIIPDWLPLNEISSLYGKGGSGKSLLALQMALAISSGQTFMGLPINISLPSLCVFCEDSKEEIHRRKEAVFNTANFVFSKIDLANLPVFLWPRVGENNIIAKMNENGNDLIAGEFLSHLEKALSDMPKGNKLLILDTLSDIYLGSENVREHVNKFIKTHIGSLLKKWDLTVLILAHPSRTGTTIGDYLSGSTAWENAVRNRLSLSKHKEFDDIMCLKRMKSNYAKSGEEIYVQWQNGCFKPVDVNNISAEILAEDLKILIQIIPKYFIKETSYKISVRSLALKILCDKEYKDFYKNKEETTLIRHIKLALKYPKEIDDFIYVYKFSDKSGSRVKHWIEKIPLNQKEDLSVFKENTAFNVPNFLD